MSEKKEKATERIEKKVPMSTYVYNDIAESVEELSKELGLNKTSLASKLVEVTMRGIMDIEKQYRCTKKEAFKMWIFHYHQCFDFSQYRY